MATATVTVSIAGAGDMDVHPAEGNTVADVIFAAADALGVTRPNLDNVGIVADGQNVTADAEVGATQHVAAAPAVANG